ncbi:MAG: hypothetical protein CL944_00100 [Candidatus Diapherotrites archaeon]|uniref:Uncharacterized protein n=1 Tax=Candidatus Iainarchaeum sp. TaxID=3101447 RepID=A0A2D6LNU4_9ARCH|nr:hypothetical protein [Candidatus Diapherotrites archaeon]|tara:strand:+ start:15793 stop:16680 length:888 start_codon:yes stop_codon:yes gene_type:complete
MAKESIFDGLKKQSKKPGKSDSVNAAESSSYPDKPKQQTPTEPASDKSRASLFGRKTSSEEKPKPDPSKPKEKNLFGFLKQKPKNQRNSQTVGSAFGSNKPHSMRENIGSKPHELDLDKTDEIISKIGSGSDEKSAQKDQLKEKPEPVISKPVEHMQPKPESIGPKSFPEHKPEIKPDIKPDIKPEIKPEIKQDEFQSVSEQKPKDTKKPTVGESFSSKNEPVVKKVSQKNNETPSEWQEETASSLAKEILDSRINKKAEYKQKESNLMNLIVILLIITGAAILAGIWYFYLGGS